MASLTQNTVYFEYGQTELEYLVSKDAKLAEVIETLGVLERPVTPDLFTALMRTIVGQQISVKAQATIWQRVLDTLPSIDAITIASYDAQALQKLGLSHRKVSYMQDIADKITSHELDLTTLYDMTDEQIKTELCKLRGIGEWSAEMLMTFSMQRPNIISFGDLAILRGLRMLHHHRVITPKLFQKYKNRYAPYGSVASLYLWAIAGGAIADMKDYKVKDTAKKTDTKTSKKQASKKPISNKTMNSTPQENIAFYHTTLGMLEIRSSDDCISYVQSVGVDAEIDMTHAQPNALTDLAIQQIREYLAGQRTSFDIAIKQQGTPFQQQVWQTLIAIPYATTMSYKQVATQIGNAQASRAIGMANNKNNIAIIVPCHRVIGSNGSLVGYAGGLTMKKQLLDIEKRYKL